MRPNISLASAASGIKLPCVLPVLTMSLKQAIADRLRLQLLLANLFIKPGAMVGRLTRMIYYLSQKLKSPLKKSLVH